MHKLFNNILLPVSLERHSALAIEKAVEFARQFNCDLHLLHVTRNAFWRSWSAEKLALKKSELHGLRNKYASLLPKGCLLHASVQEGDLENALAEYSAINQIDLIFAHKRRRVFPALDPGLNINRLAAKTNCPVLSLLSGPLFEGIKNIVLPVGNCLPLRKITLAIYMAKNSNAAIHLISVNGNHAESKSHIYLQKTYQLLRENTMFSIKCKTVEGENIADTTLEYARRVEADLILVNPGAESLLSGPMNRLFSKFLFNQSSIPVITVA